MTETDNTVCNSDMPAKIPLEALLRLNRQEIGKLESYVAELEDRIEALEQENRQLRSCEDKLFAYEKFQVSQKVYEDELNKRIVKRNTNLKRANTELKSEVNRLINEIITLRKQLEDRPEAI